ncbi:type 4a pilus biogenesis protein PilO [Magnetococcales bacterium HHB-1]
MDLDLDISKILFLKLIEKVAIGFAILILVGAGYWFFWFQDTLQEIQVLDKKIRNNKSSIAKKRAQLKRIPQLKAELEELKIREKEVSRQLPTTKEIPALLTAITQAGHEQSLEFLLFQPRREVASASYLEVPVDLKVRGEYHQVARFFNRITQMPRIVAVTNVGMNHDKGNKLVISARASTFRFLEFKELKKQGKKKGKKKKKKKGKKK